VKLTLAEESDTEIEGGEQPKLSRGYLTYILHRPHYTYDYINGRLYIN